MGLKTFFRWIGTQTGKLLRFLGQAGWKILFYLGIIVFIFLGIFLTFLGNILVLLLGFVLTLCVYFLKGFAWFTNQLMSSTKWASTKVSDYTESFYDGISSVFKQEEEHLEQEIQFLIKVEKL